MSITVRSFVVLIGIMLGIGAPSVFVLLSRTSNATNKQPARVETPATPQISFASPGRIEGRSETTEVGAGIDGVLSAVLVEEGQKVRAGQVIARLDCHDIENAIAADNAAVESSRQIRERLLRGGRDEERRAAAAETAATRSVLVQSQLQFDRISKLLNDGVVSRDDLDRARRDLDVATSTVKAAEQRELLSNATPLKEEVARADADVLTAQEKVKVDKARLDKCSITAPLSGTVLRVVSKPGETVSTITRSPIISLSDTSQLCVRAEVDERDIGRVSTGQKVQIVVDAYPDQKFYGRVKRIGQLMGRKAVRSGDPSEKSDRDVLDVMVELDQTDAHLVVGLRVTAQFLATR